MTPPLEQAVVVLVEPWEPGNVGAVARAMKNLGARDLRLVVALESTRTRLRTGDAVRLATHGADLLAAARFFDALPEALADCTAAFAFTARTGRFRLPRHGFEESVRRMAAAVEAGPAALVFGTEERGLSSDHLRHATELVCIPAPGEHAVFNLSQSVLLALWELGGALGARREAAPPRRAPAPRANMQQRRALEEDLDRLLVELDYRPRGPGSLHHRVRKRLLDWFDRGGSQRDDAALLLSLAKAVRRKTGPGRAGPAPGQDLE